MVAFIERFVAAGASGGDGLDPLGLALSNATYDHTGNVEGERHLSLAGAFAAYTFVTGDRIALKNAAGGVAAGLYEIASKVDADAILLVTNAGLTADSTTDVDSSPGPWTFAEMIAAAPAAGTRVNVKAGAYTEGATTLPSNGTAIAPIVIRGYNTTIGDCDNLGRLATGMLDVEGTANDPDTPMPDITITSAWTPSPFCYLQNLDITGALSSYLITSTSLDNFGFVNCRMVNTQNNAAAGCLVGDNMVSLVNCDFSCTGAAHTTVVDIDVSSFIIGCTFKGTLNGTILLSINSGIVTDSVFFGMGNTTIGISIQTGTSNLAAVNHCTFYNLGSAVQHVNLVAYAHTSITNCHVTDCAKFIDNLYSATSAVSVIEMNNRLRDVTTSYTGVYSITIAGALSANTLTGDATTDYVSTSNLRLISTAPGKGQGIMPYRDIGAYQCAYPTLPAAAQTVCTGTASFGYADALYDGTKVVPGEASNGGVLAQQTGAAARGGSGTCAKFTPPANKTSYGYWDFYVPVTAAASTFTFYWAKSAAAFGSDEAIDAALKISIWDTDDPFAATPGLIDGEVVDITAADTAYHAAAIDFAAPAAAGLVRVRIELKDGTTAGFLYLDDFSMAVT